MGELANYTIDQVAGALALTLGSVGGLCLILFKSRKKRLAETSGARRRRQLKLKNSLLKPEAKIKKEKENEKKLLKDYNNPKRKDPLANLTGPKKDEVKKDEPLLPSPMVPSPEPEPQPQPQAVINP